jgi:hypothetical protein
MHRCLKRITGSLFRVGPSLPPYKKLFYMGLLEVPPGISKPLLVLDSGGCFVSVQ